VDIETRSVIRSRRPQRLRSTLIVPASNLISPSEREENDVKNRTIVGLLLVCAWPGAYASATAIS